LNYRDGNNFQFNEILKIENFYQCVFKLTQTAGINISSSFKPLSVGDKSNISAYIAVKNVDNFLISKRLVWENDVLKTKPFVLQQKNFPGTKSTKSTTSNNKVTVSWTGCVTTGVYSLFYFENVKNVEIEDLLTYLPYAWKTQTIYNRLYNKLLVRI
jgi:hypothetical protein